MGYYCLNCKKKVEDEDATHCPECGHLLTLVSPKNDDDDEIPEVEGMKSRTSAEDNNTSRRRENRGERDTVKVRDDSGGTRDPDDFGLPDGYTPFEVEMPEEEEMDIGGDMDIEKDKDHEEENEESGENEKKECDEENLMDFVLDKIIKVKEKLEEED